MWKGKNSLYFISIVKSSIHFHSVISTSWSLTRKCWMWILQSWIPQVTCCQSTNLLHSLIQKGKWKASMFDIAQEDADHALKSRPTAESRNCNRSALHYSKPFKCALNDKSLSMLLAWVFFPLFCLGRFIQGARGASRHPKGWDWGQSVCCFLLPEDKPISSTGQQREPVLFAGSCGISFFLEQQLSWYLKVKPDYNKANRKVHLYIYI